MRCTPIWSTHKFRKFCLDLMFIYCSYGTIFKQKSIVAKLITLQTDIVFRKSEITFIILRYKFTTSKGKTNTF